jgi:broad-specificity NMP kinase
VRRVLITGMSATGKSTVVAVLKARGLRAVDLDTDEYSEWVSPDPEAPGLPVEPERDWVWREDRVRELLDRDEGDVLFVSGCAANMGPFLPRFDHVVLLTAPDNVIAMRLSDRTTGYGTNPGEVARVLDLVREVEPRLRRVADTEIDTSAALDDVIDAVLSVTAGR